MGDDAWVRDTFVPTVAKRGAAIIEARGASSAASAANAAMEHVNDWVNGTPEGIWTSVAMPSDGSYGVPEGLVCGFPAVSKDGAWEIVQGLDLDAHAREMIDVSVAELDGGARRGHGVGSAVAPSVSVAEGRRVCGGPSFITER